MFDVAVWGAAMAVAFAAGALVFAALGQAPPRWLATHGNAQGVVALAAGAAAGQALLQRTPHWPPASALDRFLVFGVLATIATMATVRGWFRRGAGRWIVRAVLALGLVWLLLHQSVYLQGGLAWVHLELIVSAVLLVALQALSAGMASRQQQTPLAVALAAALLTTGLLVMMAGYIGGGEATLPWAAAVAGVTLAARLGDRGAHLTSMTELAIVVLFGLVFVGRYFGGLTSSTAAVLLLTPGLCGVPEISPARSWTPRRRAILRWALPALVLWILLGIAKQRFERDMSRLVRGPSTAPEGFA